MTQFRKTHVPHSTPSPRLSVEDDPAEAMPSVRSLLKTLVFGIVLGLAVVGVSALIALPAILNR